MMQQIERPEATIARQHTALPSYENVFPRWLTLFVMMAWVAVMAWAVNFSTITFS